MNHPYYTVPGTSYAPPMQKRANRSRIFLIVSLALFSLLLVGTICVGAPYWLAYQINKGLYYGYITVDDPFMTLPEQVGKTTGVGKMDLTVTSMRQTGNLFIAHIKMTDPADDFSGGRVGAFSLYNNPSFNTASHHYVTSSPIQPEYALPDEILPGNTIETDLIFKLPPEAGKLVLIWSPDGVDESPAQHAWSYPAQTCAVFC